MTVKEPIEDFHARRVEQMLKTAKTKADLEYLVRSLDARNVQLMATRDRLATELAQCRLNTGRPTRAQENPSAPP